jgi:hypothetical protein
MILLDRIIRVFPRKTSYTPDDDYAFVGFPPIEILEHDAVHISCVFTWDRKYAEELAFQWEGRTNKPVSVGGPAFGSWAEDFQQGMYIKNNITFTTRGCNNRCPWCIVPSIEGNLRELPILCGNIIQDNNFMQSSKSHKNKVFQMLKTQKQICFKGGLEADLIDDHFVDAMNSLYYTRGSKKYSRISELWLACDTDGSVKSLQQACEKLSEAGFDREKIKCYVLIGDDMEKNESRLQEVYHAGAMPFAQLYQPFEDEKLKYSDNWNKFHRMWSRPAATRAHVEKGTHYRDFQT